MYTRKFKGKWFQFDEDTGKVYWRSPNGSWIETGKSYGNQYFYMGVAKKNYLVHRFVWLIVYGSFPVGNIRHKNGEKRDNRLANLEEFGKQKQ